MGAGKRLVAIVTARGGSKRLPRKNVLPLLGIPLLSRTIRAAHASVSVSRCAVTTDDPEIAALARAEGAVVIRRPTELATDTATSVDTVLHALDELRALGDEPAAFVGIDLGCGTGHVAMVFARLGLRMTASEYGEQAVKIVKSCNPQLEIEEIDMATFRRAEAFDLVFAREVYLFTRVNAYEQQAQVVSNVVDSLRPGGVFLLVGSDVSYPNCLEHDRIIDEFRRDSRIARVTDKYYESVLKHFRPLIFGRASYQIVALLLAPLIAFRKRFRGWASIYVIAFVKR